MTIAMHATFIVVGKHNKVLCVLCSFQWKTKSTIAFILFHIIMGRFNVYCLQNNRLTVVFDFTVRMSSNETLMLTISGIRGIIGESLTPEVICKYVCGFAGLQLTKNLGKSIILGYDTRPAVSWIKECTIGALMACGIEVTDIGVVPTPTVQLMVQQFNAAGGIVITASHNPQQWCGLKFIDSTGIFLDQHNCDEMFSCKHTKFAQHDALGSVKKYDNAIEDHIKNILSLKIIDSDEIRKNRFKVAVDTINGAGSVAVPRLLRELGCEVTELNTEPTGIFAHMPEPIAENLTQLAAVTAKGNDIGIAVDPDSDRCVLIGENGQPLVEEYTLALAVYLAVKYNGVKTPVCKNISTTRAIDDICKENDVQSIVTAIGEVNVAVKMVEVGSEIGGEGNGGVMLKDCHIGRDALVAVACVLQLFSLERKKNPSITISQIKASLPQWYISKMKIPLKQGIDVAALIEKWRALIVDRYGDSLQFNEIDGLRIDHPDWWVHIRKSNTEPIVRVIGEGRTQKEADDVCTRSYNEFMELMK
jgi:phosphomannomutase